MATRFDPPPKCTSDFNLEGDQDRAQSGWLLEGSSSKRASSSQRSNNHGPVHHSREMLRGQNQDSGKPAKAKGNLIGAPASGEWITPNNVQKAAAK